MHKSRPIIAGLLSGIILLTLSCKSHPVKPEDKHGVFNKATVNIIYTNDEHGWMEAGKDQDGAASMMGLWRSQAGYTDDASTLVISGGDNWTGPAISSWFHGASMAEVMNAMEYDVSAIGNHEFDFTAANLAERAGEAVFPYLAANLRRKADGAIPRYALPYTIEENNGVRVGIVGLASVTTPLSVFPAYVAEYDFIAYETALNEVLPQVRAENVDMVIIVGHLVGEEMEALAPYAASNNIPLITGGHSHEMIDRRVRGVTLFQAGSYMQHYGHIQIDWDTKTDTLIGMRTSILENRDGVPEASVAAIVESWQAKADAALAEVIGYVDEEVDRYAPAMANMITDSWLRAMPRAQVALTNQGGVRQSIPAGDITLATMVGLLPFENSIYQLEVTGAQLLEVIPGMEPAGVKNDNGWVFMNGEPIVADSVYTLLTTDYIYSLTDNNLSDWDSNPYDTGVNWRQPLIDWIKSLKTGTSNPLNQYLDPASRK